MRAKLQLSLVVAFFVLTLVYTVATMILYPV